MVLVVDNSGYYGVSVFCIPLPNLEKFLLYVLTLPRYCTHSHLIILEIKLIKVELTILASRERGLHQKFNNVFFWYSKLFQALNTLNMDNNP